MNLIKKVIVVYQTDGGESTQEYVAENYSIEQERGLCRKYDLYSGDILNTEPNGNFRFTVMGWIGPKEGSLDTEK